MLDMSEEFGLESNISILRIPSEMSVRSGVPSPAIDVLITVIKNGGYTYHSICYWFLLLDALTRDVSHHAVVLLGVPSLEETDWWKRRRRASGPHKQATYSQHIARVFM